MMRMIKIIPKYSLGDVERGVFVVLMRKASSRTIDAAKTSLTPNLTGPLLLLYLAWDHWCRRAWSHNPADGVGLSLTPIASSNFFLLPFFLHDLWYSSLCGCLKHFQLTEQSWRPLLWWLIERNQPSGSYITENSTRRLRWMAQYGTVTFFASFES